MTRWAQRRSRAGTSSAAALVTRAILQSAASLTGEGNLNATRAQYRLAGLEAVGAADLDEAEDKNWGLELESDGPDVRTIRRGSVWSRRLVSRVQTVPELDDDAELSVCVQRRDTANDGLSPDCGIDFVIAVTLEVETDVQYDIHEEVEQAIRVRLHRSE